MGRQRAKKRARRAANALAESRNPLSAAKRYVDSATVFGGPITPSALVDRIKTFNWRDSFVRLGQLAADVAHDKSGPRSKKVQAWAREQILEMTGIDPRAIANAHAWARGHDDAVIVHEEGVDFLQHVVLLHGLEEGDAPSDRELVLWLIGAGQFLGEWENDADADQTEQLIAEIVRVSRFNNHEDPVNLLVRVRQIFGKPPFEGALSKPETWAAIQQAAFGQSFEQHLATRVVPFYGESLRWGTDEGRLPVLVPEQWVRNLGDDGKPIVHWVFDLAKTRDEINALTRTRMLPDGLLPRAPTALVRHPILRLSDDRVGVASPWRVLAHLRTGIWAAFLNGTKAVLGKPNEWFPAFGYMFEEWLRTVARWAAAGPAFRGRLLLPDFPGSANEIDDVVFVEGNTTFLFSAKARLVEEPVARHAKSQRMVMDWYEKYFFAAGDDEFRGGAVRQFDRRINRIRAGTYKDFPADNRIVPVLVTYDSLCEEFLLYKWLQERCKALGVLQQEGVTPLVLAHVDDFDRLMARASRGLSLLEFFKAREFAWDSRKLQLQLGVYELEDRLPQVVAAFEELMNSVSIRLAGQPPR